MASEEEEKALENQLELQLLEQKDSLTAVNDAVSADPFNSELIAVQEELLQAIKDAEEGLLMLKRSRLLREVDSVISCSSAVEAESLQLGFVGPEDFSVGSRCRFRYGDGRWYNGQIIDLTCSGDATISFLTPTSPKMLICKFFLQKRCRYGSSCRLSHGVNVPLQSLKKYVPPLWNQSMVGSKVWVVSDGNDGIWKEAEMESWDDRSEVGKVVFRNDGSFTIAGIEALAASEFALMSDEDESELSSEEFDSSDFEEDNVEGLGFLRNATLPAGVQTETSIFAKWEKHTRGVASKMMANMGYREGMRLGASGQGILDPIIVQVLPPKLSLDHALESQKLDNLGENHRKKRSRGGTRKREKKIAQAIRDAKDEEERRPDVFSLINDQLAMHHKALTGELPVRQNAKDRSTEKVDRRSLVAFEEDVKELKNRIGKYEEIANRNRKDKVVYQAAMKKLTETQKALAVAQAAHATASNAVSSKEKEKKWLKF